MADSVLRNSNGQFTSERARKDGRVCGKRQPDAVIEARRQNYTQGNLQVKLQGNLYWNTLPGNKLVWKLRGVTGER